VRRLCLLAVLVLAACASGPKFETVENSLASTSTGNARIFIYRSTTLGAAIQPEIRLNDKVVGKAEPQGVFFVDVAPGPIEVVSGSEVEKKLTFQVEPGDRRYVRMAVGFGVLVWRVYPELVDEAEAKKEIAGLSYTGGATSKQ
jgi:uncharacterized protein DUF2846